MKAAYVCADPGVPVFGRKGSSTHARAIATALVRRGVAVELFAARTGGEAPPVLRGCPVH